MSMDRRTFLKSSALTLGALATGCAAGLGGSALASASLQTYKLGRLSVTVPSFLKPQIEKFVYVWDSRTPNNKNYSLAYPIKVYEYPFKSVTVSAKQEWENSVFEIISNYIKRIDLYFDWDVGKLFNAPAHFICYDEGRHYNFHIVILEESNIRHIVGLNSYRYPDEPKKDDTTSRIIHILAEFYKKYRYGHSTISGNVFHTYYGEIINNIFNYDERMSIFFADIEDTYRFSLSTDTNPTFQTESDIEVWMQRLKGFGLYSRSRMKKIPHFPGRGWESLKKDDDNMAFWSFYYEGPGSNSSIPSFTIKAGKSPDGDMDTFNAMWEVIVQNLRPLQPGS